MAEHFPAVKTWCALRPSMIQVYIHELEAAALRVQDVDLDAATVTVADTGQHKPKTRDSYRTISICDEVLDAIRCP
jgi:hypothetical protein